MSKTPNAIILDTEIKQCTITKPYEGLQSDFGKKLIDHLATHSKFKEEHIKEIVYTLEDQTHTLTTKEANDFIEFMNEHQDFFDAIIKRYK